MNTRNQNARHGLSPLPVLTGALLSLVVGQALSAPLFGPAASYGVSTRPHWVNIADLNRDGRPDLAVTNVWGNSISVLLGNGDGSFQGKTNVPLTPSRSPKIVEFGDLNDDGALDMVTANQESQTISVLVGNGNGTFRPTITYGTLILKPHGLDVGDINRDGKLDIVVVGWGGNQLGVRLGRGDGTFFPAEMLYATGLKPFEVIIADFNRDGYNDAATSNSGSRDISVLLNNRAGGFSAGVRYAAEGGPFGIGAADLDRDGDLDIVTANEWSNNASVLLGNGDGTFKARVNYTTGRRPKGAVIVDVNGDAKPDIVVANNVNYPQLVDPNADSVSVLLGVGNGAFLPKTDYPARPAPFYAAVGDLNCDGAPDLVTPSYWDFTVNVQLNTLGSQVPCGWSVTGD